MPLYCIHFKKNAPLLAGNVMIIPDLPSHEALPAVLEQEYLLTPVTTATKEISSHIDSNSISLFVLKNSGQTRQF
jgi:hypothetical protein